MLATQLCQVTTRVDPDPDGQPLHHQAQDGGPEEKPEEFELGHRSGLQVGVDVARVQVGDRHQESGPRVRPKLPKTKPKVTHMSYLETIKIFKTPKLTKKPNLNLGASREFSFWK